MPCNQPRRGFTLLELLVVITVIIALAGIGMPTYKAVMNQMKTSATRTLVKQVAMAIDAYRPQRWFWTTDPSVPMQNSGWTFGLKTAGVITNSNGDAITLPTGVTIDAMPQPLGYTPTPSDQRTFEQAGSFTAGVQLFNSGYKGFYDMAGEGIDARYANDSVKNNKLPHHQMIDAWGEPLRVVFGKKVPGGGCAVWSPGRNRVDNIGADLRPVASTVVTANGKTYSCDDIRSWVEVDDEDNP